ncbi:MAG: Calx-beta domain-containing protein, partial [Usitatibacteraceae bacterium]
MLNSTISIVPDIAEGRWLFLKRRWIRASTAMTAFRGLRSPELLCAVLLCTVSALGHAAVTNRAELSPISDGSAEFVTEDREISGKAAKAMLANSSAEIVRSRAVALDVSLLQNTRAAIEAGTPQTLRIGFFNDVALDIELTRVERVGGNATAYIGKVAGKALSSAVIVEESGVVSGNVNVGGKKFQIRNLGDAFHFMREVDADALPADHGTGANAYMQTLASAKLGERAVAAKVTAPPTAAINTLDDGSMIDVMVAYTPAARISQGGTLPMKSLINLGIAETNAAYANSLVTQRVRLVYAGEVNYAEADYATDLARLAGTNDGFMDEVHQLRDLYGADIVSLWGNYPPASGCGLANLMLNESTSFANQAFHVVDRNCATSNYSFTHELGHNMGLQHDIFDGNAGTTVTPEGSSVSTPINYAHGYVDMPNRFRSVMAISAQCDAQVPKIDCLRIPYFSNPSVFFDNRPFFPGAAASAPTGSLPNSQEFKALNDTRDTTANFKSSVDLAGPGVVIFSPTTYTVNENGGSVTLTVTRHAGTNGAVSVAFTAVNGSATAGTDFTASSGTLSWAAGEAGTKSITIPILLDGVLDGPKAFTVALDTPTGSVSIGAPGGTSAVATVIVIDADTDSFPVGCTVPFTGWTNQPSAATAGWSVATDSFYGPPCSLKSNPVVDGGK